MVKKFPVKPVIEELFCDICDVEMEWDGKAPLTDPPHYRYTCPQGHEHLSGVVYPRIKHAKVEK